MNARSSSLGIVLLLSCLPVSSMEGRTPQSDSRGETDLLGSIAAKFREYKVSLEPDKDEAEWWAGAPSVVRDKNATFWLACRLRTADSPRGLRGYEIRILRSRDGMLSMDRRVFPAGRSLPANRSVRHRVRV